MSSRPRWLSILTGAGRMSAASSLPPAAVYRVRACRGVPRAPIWADAPSWAKCIRDSGPDGMQRRRRR